MGRREKQNLIFSIVAVFGIILILVSLWYLSKGHRYKTYRNDVGGFSIKYPASWSAEENINGAAVIFFSPIENQLDIFKESVNVVVQDLSGNPMDLNKYTEIVIDQMEAVFERNIVTLVSQRSFLAKQPAYKYVFLGKGVESDMKYMVVWLVKGHKAYQVTYTSLASQYDWFLPKVEKIFSSFRID